MTLYVRKKIGGGGGKLNESAMHKVKFPTVDERHTSVFLPTARLKEATFHKSEFQQRTPSFLRPRCPVQGGPINAASLLKVAWRKCHLITK